MRSKIREYVWLTVAFLCLLAGMHQTIVLGIKQSYIFLVLALVAFLIYYARLLMRKGDK